MDTKKRFGCNTAALSFCVLLAGCANNAQQSNAELPASTPLPDQFSDELAERERVLEERERALQSRESALSTQQEQEAANAFVDNDLLPPNAKSGECYARIWVDAEYVNETQRIKVRDESEKVDLLPATYQWVEQQVLAKEASSRLDTIPAVYGSETERVMVSEAYQRWHTELNPNASPASDKLLAAAAAGGINLDSANPGMCYHEHFIPAKYQTVSKDVLISEASSRIETQKAQYEYVEEKVLVAEASFRYEEVPAVFKTVDEQILDKPAHTIWKKGTGPIQRIDESTGEIMCLVDVPASYKTVTKRVLVSPAATRKVEIPAKYETVKVRKQVAPASETVIEVPEKYGTVQQQQLLADAQFVWHEIHDNSMSASSRTGAKICLVSIPAKYKTVTRQVVKEVAKTREVQIPAQYKTVKVKRVLKEASEKRTVIPAVYKDITQRKLVKDGHMQWRSILCETNMTRDRISAIQRALKSKGHNPGPIDGSIGAQTIRAVNEFQRANKLPVDRYLNLQTVKALGVSAK